VHAPAQGLAPWIAPPALAQELAEACRQWDEGGRTARLFDRDATLWTGADEARWLGWLDLDAARSGARHGAELAASCRAAGLSQVLLVGMGGSSLGPEVLSLVLGSRSGLPLTIVDTVDPQRLLALLAATDLRRALVVIASKSGSTLEPSLVRDLLLARLRDVVGGKAPQHVAAITDPGSSLEREARDAGYAAIVAGNPAIGWRYSALSPFGMVPAALLGLDTADLLARADAMRDRCRQEPALRNPGVALGVAMGRLAALGRDKLTLLSSPRLAPLGAWIEQLVAESTGKAGRGILPVDAEPPGEPGAYGPDRAFVMLRLGSEPGDLDERAAALVEAGHPVLRCDVPEPEDLGAAFYQWEIATAVAGSLLGIHPFDQPDVEASKVAARRRLTSDGGAAVRRVVMAKRDGLVLEADAATASALGRAAKRSIAALLDAHASAVEPPGWIGLLAWRCEDPSAARVLDAMRQRYGRGGLVATTAGTGPRFLHSTGQLHKGGPATGRFIQVLGPASADLPVPGRSASFGRVLQAQSDGDFDVLSSRGRPIVLLRIESAEAAGALAQDLASRS
jgi:transaldolase/glucose-6-phosphate isomerase